MDMVMKGYSRGHPRSLQAFARPLTYSLTTSTDCWGINPVTGRGTTVTSTS
jgi:hypothetical protein